MTRLSPARFVIVASSLSASILNAQVQWNRIQTALMPSARSRSVFVHDDARDRIVLFGGVEPTAPYTLGDTWLFDGVRWTAANPASAPSPRQWCAATYDRQRQRVFVFGGMEWTNNAWPWVVHDDTWEWDGATWVQRSPQTRPPARAMAGCAYDEARGRVVLFGGYAFVGGGNRVINYDDTWEWDGIRWTQATPGVRPAPRANPELFYDRTRGRVVMTGGVSDDGTGNSVYLAGTWTWDGRDWTRLRPSTDPVATNGEFVAYDEARGRAVRYQGIMSGRVFEWDGTDWIRRTPRRVPSPSHRIDPCTAYDPARSRIVLFGGLLASPPFTPRDDTWTYAPTNPASFFTFGTGCAGSAGVPVLSSAERPWLDRSFSGAVTNVPNNAATALFVGASRTTYGGFALPLDLRFLGAPMCHLLVAPDVVAGLVATNGTAPWSLPIPNVATLRGTAFFTQSAALDSAANALGLVLSNGGDGTIGSK